MNLFDGTGRRSGFIPELDQVLAPLVVETFICVVPVAFPGDRFREKFLICFLFGFCKGTEPCAPANDIVFSVPHSPADGIPFHLRIRDPWRWEELSGVKFHRFSFLLFRRFWSHFQNRYPGSSDSDCCCFDPLTSARSSHGLHTVPARGRSPPYG